MQTYFLNDFKVNIPKYILPGADEYLDPANVDFEVRLFVPPSAGVFVATHIGGKYVNCKVADGQICIIADGHQLAPGEVWYEAKYHLPDSDYPDGYCTLVEKSSLGLSLTTSADVEVREEQQASVAEQLREKNESDRQTAETARQTAEAQRETAETARVAAENLRKTDEEARKTAEAQRVTAENERKAAEVQRVKDFEAMKQELAVEGRIGIFPFNAIVDTHGSVSDGTPDYETQFPSAADGAYRHIIFDKSRGTFLWEIHAGDYPNCPAGDAYRAWTGSEEYVSEGHPRADRLYRMENELYRWDGTALVSYNDAISAVLDTKADRTELSNIVGTPSDDVIEDLEPTLVTEALRKTAQTLTPAEQEQVKKNIGVSKMEMFIDMWDAEGAYCHNAHNSYPITAKYDPENAPDNEHPFVCNGIWLTYVEALDVYNHRLTRGTLRDGALRASHIRTALCNINSIYAEGFNLGALFYGAEKLEIARLSTNDQQGIWATEMGFTFANCPKLREIVPVIVDVVKTNMYPWLNTFSKCESLVSVKIKSLTHSLVFGDSPLLSLDSISFMVEHAANTSPITITLHPDAYARVTEEIFAQATNKNITFATL